MAKHRKRHPKPPNPATLPPPVSPSSMAPAASPAAGASSFSSQTKQTEHELPPFETRWTHKHPGNVAIADALSQCSGLVKHAAALLGVTRNTLKTWIDASPELQQVRRESGIALLETAADGLERLCRGEYTETKRLDESGRPRRRYTLSPSLQAIVFAYRLAGLDPDAEEESDAQTQTPEEEDDDEEGETQVVGETELPDNGRGPKV